MCFDRLIEAAAAPPLSTLLHSLTFSLSLTLGLRVFEEWEVFSFFFLCLFSQFHPCSKNVFYQKEFISVIQFYTLSRLFLSDLIEKFQGGDQKIEERRKMKTGSAELNSR